MSPKVATGAFGGGAGEGGEGGGGVSSASESSSRRATCVQRTVPSKSEGWYPNQLMAVSREDGSVRTGVLPPLAEVEDSGMVLVVVADFGAWPTLAPNPFATSPSTHQAAMQAKNVQRWHNTARGSCTA